MRSIFPLCTLPLRQQDAKFNNKNSFLYSEYQFLRKNQQMKIAYLVRIKGRVTGIGFRYSALDKAGNLPSLRGYVRNVGYGEVEAFIQGEQDEVEQMLAWLHRGPALARIESINFSKVPLNPNLTSFGIG